jgi:hypothetical protein
MVTSPTMFRIIEETESNYFSLVYKYIFTIMVIEEKACLLYIVGQIRSGVPSIQSNLGQVKTLNHVI